MTAKELQITGCAIMYNNINLIISEGGAKAMRKFKKLMLHRIDWTKTKEDEMQTDKKDESTTNTNKCVLIWEVRNVYSILVVHVMFRELLSNPILLNFDSNRIWMNRPFVNI
jgi:hypothetical protein